MKLFYRLANESYKYNTDSENLGRDPVTLVAARGDWVAFQLLLSSDEDFTLSTGRDPVFSPVGPLPNVRVECAIEGIPGAAIIVSPIGLIEDDYGIPTADLILNNENVHVRANSVQPVWIEAVIPRETVPGIYAGRVVLYTHRMFEDERKAAELPFAIEVRNVIMPVPRDYVFHLDLWQHLSNISRKHEVPLWSDEHFAVVENYVKSLAELGQKAITVIASEIPWSGQMCFRTRSYLSDLFEYSMIRVEKDADGRFSCDYSAMQRYIDLCFKYGIDKEIEVFGLTNIWTDDSSGYGKVAEDYPDAVRIRYYDRGDGCYKYMKSADEIIEYISALERYFKETGLIDRVLIVADEPVDVEKYRESLNMIAKAAPSFKFKTAINHAEFIAEFKDTTRDFVPNLASVCREWDLLCNMREVISGRLLWYVCCGPRYPNTFIRSDLVESRLIGILTAYMKLDGFLRWNYTVWPEKPRERITYRSPGWPAGDTNFVYPANDGRPILTLRYKNLKRGIEDYELIAMLRRKRADAEEVLEKLWSRIIRAGNITEFIPADSGMKPREELFSLDYEDYNSFRKALLEELEKLG